MQLMNIPDIHFTHALDLTKIYHLPLARESNYQKFVWSEEYRQHFRLVHTGRWSPLPTLHPALSFVLSV